MRKSCYSDEVQFIWSILLSIGLSALVVNSLILILVIKLYNSLFRTEFPLILSISVINILSCILSIIETCIKWTFRYPSVFRLNWFCAAFSGFNQITLFLSGMLIGVLSLERFFLICLGMVLSVKLIIIIVIIFTGLYLIPIIATSATNSFSTDSLRAYCIPAGSVWADLNNNLTIIALLIPFLCILISYIGISFKVFHRHSRTILIGTNLRVAINSLTTITLYGFCFLPKIIALVLMQLKYPVPYLMDILAPLGINAITLINPILILLLHSRFRREAYQMYLGRSNSHSTTNFHNI